MHSDTYARILVIRLSSLGDVLLTTPVVRALRKKYPGAVIDFCVREEFVDAIRHNPHINNILLYNSSDEKVAELRNQFIQNNYDVILDLQKNIRTKLLLRGVETKIMEFKKNSVKKFLLVYLKLNLMRGLPQIPKRYASAFPGLTLDDAGLELHLPEGIKSVVTPDDNTIGFCPGSRHYTKMWPHEYFTDLGEILNLHGFTVALLGGKQDQGLCKLIASGIPGAINLCNDNDLYQTAANIKRCAAVVTNDSGLMHIACAMHVPVVAIFGSTVQEFGFTPFQNKSVIVENTLAGCRPCSHYGKDKCPLRHFNCMMKLTPAMVYQRLNTLLNR